MRGTFFVSGSQKRCRQFQILVRPANLVATSAAEAQIITEALTEAPDLLRARQRAKEASRAQQLAAQLEAQSHRERRLFDALEASVSFSIPELANFEPIVPWHSESLTTRQAAHLRSFEIDPASVRNRGHGSFILEHLHRRRRAGLATVCQLRFLVRFGYPQPLKATFDQASAFLDKRFRPARRRSKIALLLEGASDQRP